VGRHARGTPALHGSTAWALRQASSESRPCASSRGSDGVSEYQLSALRTAALTLCARARLSAGAESPLSVGDACRPLAARGAPPDDPDAGGPGEPHAHAFPGAAAAAAGAAREARAQSSASASTSAPSARTGGGARAGGGAARARRGGGAAAAGSGAGARAAAGGEQELRCRLLIDCMVRPAGGLRAVSCAHKECSTGAPLWRLPGSPATARAASRCSGGPAARAGCRQVGDPLSTHLHM